MGTDQGGPPGTPHAPGPDEAALRDALNGVALWVVPADIAPRTDPDYRTLQGAIAELMALRAESPRLRAARWIWLVVGFGAGTFVGVGATLWLLGVWG